MARRGHERDSNSQQPESADNSHLFGLPESYLISGYGGPYMRNVYAKAAQRWFGEDPTSIEAAESMVMLRGYERLVVRLGTTILSLLLAGYNSKQYLEKGEYGNAAIQSSPALINFASNVTLFIRDKFKYGSFLGAIGNPGKKAELVARMMTGEKVAAKTSAAWTARFTSLGGVLTKIGWVLEFGTRLESDNPQALAEQRRQEADWQTQADAESARRKAEGYHVECRSEMWGLVQTCSWAK